MDLELLPMERIIIIQNEELHSENGRDRRGRQEQQCHDRDGLHCPTILLHHMTILLRYKVEALEVVSDVLMLVVSDVERRRRTRAIVLSILFSSVATFP